MSKLQNLDTGLVSEIKTILETAKNNIVRNVNSEMILAYWHIGKRLSVLEEEMNQNSLLENKTMIILSKELTK